MVFLPREDNPLQQHWNQCIHGLVTSFEHCLLYSCNAMCMLGNILWEYYGHCQAGMMVADGLVPIWHQGIYNHHDAASQFESMHARCDPGYWCFKTILRARQTLLFSCSGNFKKIKIMGHPSQLTAIDRATILAPCHVVKSLQLIRRPGPIFYPVSWVK